MATVFSMIINGDLPGRFVYEDDEIVAFLTIEPMTQGHTLVVPRRHVGTLLELTDEEGAAVIKAARDVAHALLATFQPLGILTFQNNGVYSGQDVPHYHFHVVPRQPGSDWGIGPPQLHKFPDAGRAAGTTDHPTSAEERRRRARVDAETLARAAARIRRHLPERSRRPSEP